MADSDEYDNAYDFDGAILYGFAKAKSLKRNPKHLYASSYKRVIRILVH
jgi:hypothetical protein